MMPWDPHDPWLESCRMDPTRSPGSPSEEEFGPGFVATPRSKPPERKMPEEFTPPEGELVMNKTIAERAPVRRGSNACCSTWSWIHLSSVGSPRARVSTLQRKDAADRGSNASLVEDATAGWTKRLPQRLRANSRCAGQELWTIEEALVAVPIGESSEIAVVKSRKCRGHKGARYRRRPVQGQMDTRAGPAAPLRGRSALAASQSCRPFCRSVPVFSEEKKLSIAALSHTFPEWLIIEQSTPLSAISRAETARSLTGCPGRPSVCQAANRVALIFF